jgi:hypothetical protein
MATFPGFTALIADGQLRIPPTVSGPSVIILGTTTRTTVPTLEPVKITDSYIGISALEHENGDPSELSMALESVLLAGAQNVEILKIAETSGELDSYTANTRYDALVEAYKVLRSHQVDVILPVGCYIDDTGISGSDPDGNTRINFGKQLANACHLLTSEGNTCLGVIGAMPINRVARQEAWTGAPSTLSGEYFETPTRDHVTEWTYHLTGSASGDDHSAEVLTSSGYLAGSVEQSQGVLSASYDFWAEVGGTDDVDQYGTKVDGGRYLSVVAGCVKVGGQQTVKLAAKYGSTGIYRCDNGAASYAGFISTISPHTGATNKIVPGILPIREFNREQAQDILDARFVTFFRRPRGFVVLKGITGAYHASDYTKSDFTMLTTTRITLACQDVVEQVCEPYIGEPMNSYNMNAMEAAIDSSLKALMKFGALRRYSFSIQATPDSMVLGECTVVLTIVPAFELTHVTINIALAKE